MFRLPVFRNQRLPTWLLALAVLSVPAVVAEPRIGLVLSGGGARGAAHIGVLKVLEELRIPVHAIAGTSMGALVGGAYASGVGLEEMEQRVTSIDWGDLFSDDPPRSQWPVRRKQQAQRLTWDFTVGIRDGQLRLPKGAIAGQKVQLFFTDLVKNAEGIERFDDLPIPFRAVATNLENGEMKVFDRGSLPDAMRASMSVPGVFAPMQIDGGLYVDGGLVRNLPIDVVRKMGVDLVIAVNLGTSYLKREQLGTVLGVTGQMIAILTEQNVQASLKELDPARDVLIVPDLGDITAGSFDRAAEAIAVGESAARGAASQLRRFSVDEASYLAWQKSRTGSGGRPPPVVDEVRVVGLDQVNQDLFRPLEVKYADSALDRPTLEQDLQGLYGRGDFERLDYRLQREDGRNLLIVDAIEKEWGPGYLSFGLGLLSDTEGDNRFGIRGVYRRTWINRLGAEWLTDLTVGNEANLYTEFYQPFRLDRAGFVAPYLDAGNTPVSLFREGDRVARYDVGYGRLGVDLGTTFGTAAELRAGAFLGIQDLHIDTGSPLLPEGDVTDSGVRLRLVYDTLDSAFNPRQGNRVVLDAVRPLPEFGADFDYTRLQGEWYGARSFGEHSVVVQLHGGSSLGSVMPYYEQFPLGGFLKLSGYANEQFRANKYALGGLVYYRRIAVLTPPLGRGLYLGGSLEVGRLWDARLFDAPSGVLSTPTETLYGGSLFFGADTWLGPFYLGAGLSGEGDSTVYVLLGRP